ncbi:uncharacterized protein [Porites lutea]|uniref:uncharacterized protein n=1 Tax=Porites lutea TaxID=51062 RepID=UPI003CC5DC29
MHNIFEADNTDAVLLIDASNEFSSLNRASALHNVRILRPTIATYTINTYREPARLFITGGKELRSEEGLTQSDKKQKTFQEVKLEDNATLPCPVLQEVVEKGEIFKFVTWSICTSKVCDGEEPRWKYIAGMNAQGGTESKQKGIYMSQDGSLCITKVQMKDVTTYQCKVTPPDGTDPTAHNITLFLKEPDFPEANKTKKKQTRTTKNPKATKASEGIPDYVYGMVGIIVILVFLLAAAMVYIRHQKRMLNARSNA